MSEDPPDETLESDAETGDEASEAAPQDSEGPDSDAVEFDPATERPDEHRSDDTDVPVVDESTVPRIEETACSNCGVPIASDATVCPDCGAEQTGQSDRVVKDDETTATAQAGQSESAGKDIEPLFSAILSFFLPGIGHVYHGQSERGIVIFAGWIGWWLFLGLVFLLVTVVTLGIGVLTIVFLPVIDFLYHVVAAADAYVQGEKIASGQKEI